MTPRRRRTRSSRRRSLTALGRGTSPPNRSTCFWGLRTDLEVTGYPTYADLHEYMLAVSGQPALWINAVLEPSSDAAAEMAVSLSHAIYLLHFVRDFPEDLELGRVYLPEEDIGRSGFGRREIEELVEQGSVRRAMRPAVRRQASRINRLLAVSEGW
ncbi:squalene/phytoene synthase family protein [Actinopolyspora erythraea]|nr:squalene/phytoene synthase family protein [Actinopolyspora erythraea]